MDDNPLDEKNDKSVLFETPPEATPPGAEFFSIQAQKDKFLGGKTAEKPEVTKEQKALERVGDIYDSSWSHTTRIEKLPKILRQGVVSQEFADRINEEYERENNPEDPELTWWKKEFDMYKAGYGRQAKQDHFEQVAVLIKKPSQGAEDIDYRYAVIPRRVAPREFIGLLIPDQRVNMSGKELSDEESRNFAINEAIRLAESNFTNDISLPIYGTTGDLLWPKYIPKPEVRGANTMAKAA